MKLQYLGTGAAEGWPGLFCDCTYCETARTLGGRNIRTRSQAAVYGEASDMLLIDLAPDTYMHCLTHGLRLDKVSHMLITHSHCDHFAPYELQYRMEWYVGKPCETLHMYGNETVRDKYMIMLENEKVTTEQVNIVFHVPAYFEPFTVGGFTVTSLMAHHDPSERCMFYLISYASKNILYAHDTGVFPEESWSYLQGKHLDLVSLDCTNGALFHEGSGHMGLEDAINIKKRLVSMGCINNNSQLVLNHFSHNGELHYDAMKESAAPHGLQVSYDGAVWEI